MIEPKYLLDRLLLRRRPRPKSLFRRPPPPPTLLRTLTQLQIYARDQKRQEGGTE